MSDRADHDDARDDGRTWGHVDDEGIFRPLPKRPMLLAGLGPPPFSITMSDQRVRHIIHDPKEDSAND